MGREDCSRVRERYEAFWQGELLDRPILQIRASRPDAPGEPPPEPEPADPDEAFARRTDPARVLAYLERQIARTHHAGDAFPLVFPMATSYVAIEAAYLGGRYSVTSGTAWCDPIIDDWAAREPLTVAEDNPWWRATRRLLEAAAEAFAGRAAVGIPDLQGGGQILDLLRGTERLAVDLLENPEPVHQALVEIDAAWLYYWRECNRLILPHQDGYVDWLGVWSDVPMVTVECDFSIMISPEMFETFFLPGLDRQARWVDRTIYHLDGEGAVRHLDALLSLEALDGIQWVPGAGAKRMSAWIPLLQRIQRGGKLLVINCRPADVDTLLDALAPEGLVMSTRCRAPEEADDLAAHVARRFC